MSNIDWTAHDPELLRRAIAQRDAGHDSTIPLHPCRCGPCLDCREHLTGVPQTGLASADLERRLIRHAERYGPEEVVETAVQWLPADRASAVERALVNRGLIAGRQRRTRRGVPADVKGQVVELLAAGIVVEAVADQVGVSDRVVRSIRRKSRTSPPGLLDPHGYAENTPRSGSDGPQYGSRLRRGRRALSASEAQIALDVLEALAP